MDLWLQKRSRTYLPLFCLHARNQRFRSKYIQRHTRRFTQNNRLLAYRLNEAKERLNAKEEEIDKLNYKLLYERKKLIAERDVMENRMLNLLDDIRGDFDMRVQEYLDSRATVKDTSVLSVTNVSSVRCVEDPQEKRRKTTKRITELEVISEEDSRPLETTAEEPKTSQAISSQLNSTFCVASTAREDSYMVQLSESARSISPHLGDSSQMPPDEQLPPVSDDHSSSSGAQYEVSSLASTSGTFLSNSPPHKLPSNPPHSGGRSESKIYSVGNLVSSTPYRRMQEESYFPEATLSQTAQQALLREIQESSSVTLGLEHYEPPPQCTPSIFKLATNQMMNASQDAFLNFDSESDRNLNTTFEKLPDTGEVSHIKQTESEAESEPEKETVIKPKRKTVSKKNNKRKNENMNPEDNGEEKKRRQRKSKASKPSSEELQPVRRSTRLSTRK